MDPITLSLAATSLQMGGSMLDAYSQYQSAKQMAQMADWNASQSEEAGRKQASVIRDQARQTMGAARAQLAISGVSLERGTGLEIQEEITRTSEVSAMNAVLSGQLQGIQQRYEGKLARIQSKAGVVRSLLGMAGQAAAGASQYQQARGVTVKG